MTNKKSEKKFEITEEQVKKLMEVLSKFDVNIKVKIQRLHLTASLMHLTPLQISERRSSTQRVTQSPKRRT
jgi:PIN domain nuclease of toxin-antitoxin system